MDLLPALRVVPEAEADGGEVPADLAALAGRATLAWFVVGEWPVVELMRAGFAAEGIDPALAFLRDGLRQGPAGDSAPPFVPRRPPSAAAA